MHRLPRGKVDSLAAVAATADSLAGGMLGSDRNLLSLETLHSTICLLAGARAQCNIAESSTYLPERNNRGQ